LTPLKAHRDTMSDMAASIPGVCADDPLFRAPWQARIFALIVASVKTGHIPRGDFQSRLALRITQMEQAAPVGDTEDAYFDCWLAATEATLLDIGLIADGEIAAQIEAIRETIAHIRATQTPT